MSVQKKSGNFLKAPTPEKESRWNIILKNDHIKTFSLKKQNGQSFAVIYHKSTDTELYLHLKCHKTKTYTKSIPYTLAGRICTIVSNKNLIKTH